MTGSSSWWCSVQHSDFIDRDNEGIKRWARNCERHLREGLDD